MRWRGGGSGCGICPEKFRGAKERGVGGEEEGMFEMDFTSVYAADCVREEG